MPPLRNGEERDLSIRRVNWLGMELDMPMQLEGRTTLFLEWIVIVAFFVVSFFLVFELKFGLIAIMLFFIAEFSIVVAIPILGFSRAFKRIDLRRNRLLLFIKRTWNAISPARKKLITVAVCVAVPLSILVPCVAYFILFPMEEDASCSITTYPGVLSSTMIVFHFKVNYHGLSHFDAIVNVTLRLLKQNSAQEQGQSWLEINRSYWLGHIDAGDSFLFERYSPIYGTIVSKDNYSLIWHFSYGKFI